MDAATVNLMMGYLPIVLIFAVFYFLVLRPQSQAAKAHAALLGALKRGDNVLMVSGLMAKLERVADTSVVLKITNDDTVLFARSSVERLLSSEETKLLEKQLQVSTPAVKVKKK